MCDGTEALARFIVEQAGLLDPMATCLLLLAWAVHKKAIRTFSPSLWDTTFPGFWNTPLFYRIRSLASSSDINVQKICSELCDVFSSPIKYDLSEYDGFVIAVEGPDGTGKSTQVDSLVSFLKDCGQDVIRSRIIGGSPCGEALRPLILNADFDWHPVAEVFLTLAISRESVAHGIFPAAQQHKWVVCDRYMETNLAIFSDPSFGFPMDDLAILCRMAKICNGTLVEPHIVFLLDLDVAITQQRRADRWKGLTMERPDRNELRPPGFYDDLSLRYGKIAQTTPNWQCIDANQPVADIAQDMQDVIKRLCIA